MDSEIFDKAQAILTNRRKRAESENEARIDELNKKIPQIIFLRRFGRLKESGELRFIQSNNLESEEIETLYHLNSQF